MAQLNRPQPNCVAQQARARQRAREGSGVTAWQGEECVCVWGALIAGKRGRYSVHQHAVGAQGFLCGTGGAGEGVGGTENILIQSLEGGSTFFFGHLKELLLELCSLE